MRVLILGGNGMLGHKMCQVLKKDFDVYVTVRNPMASPYLSNSIDSDHIRSGIDVLDSPTVANLFAKVEPDVVINCVGIIKQLREAYDPIASIATNSLLPHQLAALCRHSGAKMVHISTDCVFSGKHGRYTEDDTPDPVDLYGRTKWLGEVTDDTNTLTLRTSIIGRELSGSHALVEWFLSQKGPDVPGFSNAVFSGLPTISLARLIRRLLSERPDLHGLYHVSAEPINKFHLLQLVRDAYSHPVSVVESPDFHIDRSLDSSKFRYATGWIPQSWPELIDEMASDPTPYDIIRSQSS